MIFRSDCRQTLILFSTSDSSRTSSSSIVTCIVLPASRISPREQNEKRQENYWANYSNIQQQFHRIFRVLYHLSVSKRIRDSVPRPLTSLQAMRLLDLRERPNEN